MENSPSTTQEILRILMEFEGSLLCLQEPSTFSRRWPNQSIAAPILFILDTF